MVESYMRFLFIEISININHLLYTFLENQIFLIFTKGRYVTTICKVLSAKIMYHSCDFDSLVSLLNYEHIYLF
jgi:hypothetical protein